ncbi:ABC transporter permease [Metamycoplasma hyosynoviae]|uniref:carbohydrate ABC transporter permease n=1 Tax=Metamycoplasma hyosynoviae TaxID=29559 RepID=UPI0004617601|nr:carbohydrate ABC transporter permease [Metamycoplasma hyosynoviae]KDE41583.1 ABC transporter permease [Metamycoplasma hyosynoviae]KDE43126.1 ABC transporter permease [Metamycoplasma hyosynoviae]KDE43527.1 ABC transporter permease [Metamycoplasma hyosynoviae]KDE43644.1 ABC transporter permease [Metamycoplasma hyosynoviae]
MLLARLKLRHWNQKRSLKSKQDDMMRPIEVSNPASIILSWTFKIFILTFFGIMIVFPFYFMLSQAIVDRQWINKPDVFLWYPRKYDSSVYLKTFEWHWENLKYAMEEGYFKAIVFTAIITAFSVVLRIAFSMTFGYAFAIKKWRFKSVSWVLFLSLLVLPEVALMSGQYQIIVKLNLHHGFAARVFGIIVPFIASVFSGFMYRNAFETIPDSVKESSLIDGAGGVKFFTKIAMPLVKSTTWTVAILTGLTSWNSYTWALLILGKSNPGTYTVINIWLAETGKIDIEGSNEPRIALPIRMAATVLTLLPMFIVYFSMRKKIMDAISRQGRATKG